jgi:hypothetical protein
LSKERGKLVKFWELRIAWFEVLDLSGNKNVCRGRNTRYISFNFKSMLKNRNRNPLTGRDVGMA